MTFSHMIEIMSIFWSQHLSNTNLIVDVCALKYKDIIMFYVSVIKIWFFLELFWCYRFSKIKISINYRK